MDLDKAILGQHSSLFIETYDRWYEHAVSANNYGMNVKDTADYNAYSSVVFAGMGGSSTVGDIVCSVIGNRDVNCRVLRSSLLPENISKETLVIASSVSGNTFETIQVVKACIEREIDVITLSSGGAMERLAKKENIRHIPITNLGAPRLSLPCLVYPLMNMLRPLDEKIDRQITSSLATMKKLSEIFHSSVPSNRNLAKKVALFIGKTLPICYYEPELTAAGIRFRNSINENAKTYAICEDIEEACHNSIVPFSYEHTTKYSLILLRSAAEDHFRNSRFDALKQFLQTKNIEILELFSKEDSPLATIMGMIYLLDYSTVYLALLRGHDPNLTVAIDYIKSAIRHHLQTDLG